MRDFLIAVRFVDGMGTLLRGGARVVKNAAGFDLPKLLVGSRGAYGAIVEASFKVFPRPPASTTLAIDYASHGDALRAFLAMGALPGELDCLDWLPPARVVLRVSGRAEALPARIARLTTAAGGHVQQVVGADEAQHWRHVREGLWVPPGWSWVTVACAPSQVEAIEAAAVTMIAHAPRRYLSGGHQLWMAWPDGEQDRFGRWLAARGLPARALTGPCRVGRPDAESELGVRLRRALDPRNIFGRGGGDAT